MIVDKVIDSAMEKKSPPSLNHASLGEAIACEPPNFIMGYYNCQGTGVLESVDTYDDDDSIAERTDLRDPPPPIQEEQQEQDKQEDSDGFDSEDDEIDDSLAPKCFLAKARCGTSSSSVVVEAGKQEQCDNKKHKNNNKDKNSVKLPVHGNKSMDDKRIFLTTAEVMAKLGEDVFDETLDDEELAAAAERWRIAKERYIVRASLSTVSEESRRDELCSDEKEEIKAGGLSPETEDQKKQADAATTDTIAAEDVPTNDADAGITSRDDAGSPPEEELLEEKSPQDPPGTHQVMNGAIDNNNGTSTVDIPVETFNHFKIEPEPTCSHENNKALEEETDFVLPEDGGNAGEDQEEEHYEVEELEEEEDPLVPLYLRNLSRSLKQLERQELSNKSRLSEQRLLLEQRRQRRMDRRQTTK